MSEILFSANQYLVAAKQCGANHEAVDHIKDLTKFAQELCLETMSLCSDCYVRPGGAVACHKHSGLLGDKK